MPLKPTSEQVIGRFGATRRGPFLLAACLLVAAVVDAGCESSSTVMTTAANLVKCQVTLSTPPTVDASGGTGSVTITTQPECAWDASSSVGWISGLAPASGQGAGQVRFQVAANDGTATREGNILVNDVQARVSQRAPCRYELTPASQSVDASGGSARVSIATLSECAWTATAEVSWISLASSSSGAGNGSVAFSVAPNTGNDRTGTISIGNQRAIVTQSSSAPPPSTPAPPAPPAPGCTFTIAPTSQNIGATGGAGTQVTVTTQSGCKWTSASNASWITLTSGATGAGNGSASYTVAANTGASRTGTLTIAGRTFTVTQAALIPQCTYSISPMKQSVGRGGGAGTVSVSTMSACAWTAVSNESWIIVTSGAAGLGDGTVGFTVQQGDRKGRDGTLTIAGKTATVEQNK